MKTKNILQTIFIFILAIIIYSQIKSIYYFEWMKKEIIIIVSALLSVTITKSSIAILTRNNKYDYLLVICYLLLLLIILFHRKVNDEKLIKLDFNYLKKWLKIIFQNKTVFLNIFGNIFLFIPLGIIINYQNNFLLIKILFLLLSVILLELIQFLLNLGVFDILDIILNFFGGIIGILLTYQKKELK